MKISKLNLFLAVFASLFFSMALLANEPEPTHNEGGEAHSTEAAPADGEHLTPVADEAHGGAHTSDKFEPGKMMALTLPPETASTGIEKAALSVKEFIKHVFPKSIFEAMAKNEILQIIVFSLFFGIGTAAIGEKGKGVIKAMDALADVMLKVTGFVMNFAPFAVFGAMTAVIAQQGISVLGNYGIFILEFYFGLLVLWIVLISAGAAVIKKRVFSLLKHILDPVLIALESHSKLVGHYLTAVPQQLCSQGLF